MSISKATMIVNYDPILQALLASLFTWGVTALGAALVFVLPANSKKFLGRFNNFLIIFADTCLEQ